MLIKAGANSILSYIIHFNTLEKIMHPNSNTTWFNQKLIQLRFNPIELYITFPYWSMFSHPNSIRIRLFIRLVYHTNMASSSFTANTMTVEEDKREYIELVIIQPEGEAPDYPHQ